MDAQACPIDCQHHYLSIFILSLCKMGKVSLLTFASLTLGVQLSTAAPTQETTQACTEPTNTLPGKVLTPGLLAVEYQ